MNKIIYYVATSLDGYISGPAGDISKFAGQSDAVNFYREDLTRFSTVIMGKNTYEFGYLFGLKPGEVAYSHMEHYIFSSTLNLPNRSPQVHIEKLSVARIQEIREKATTDIYLCGGGQFAGWLLDNNLVDQLKIKLNPIILGDGTRIFGNSKSQVVWKLIDQKSFSDGLQFLTYDRM